MTTKTPPRVLVVDDEINDIVWVLDRIQKRGYEVEVAPDEASARKRLAAVADQKSAYVLAIIDVMVASDDIRSLIDTSNLPFGESRDTGIRLCRYARRELKLSATELPMACLTVLATDPDVKRAMAELGIQLFHRLPQNASESIGPFLDRQLPPLDSVSGPDGKAQ